MHFIISAFSQKSLLLSSDKPPPPSLAIRQIAGKLIRANMPVIMKDTTRKGRASRYPGLTEQTIAPDDDDGGEGGSLAHFDRGCATRLAWQRQVNELWCTALEYLIKATWLGHCSNLLAVGNLNIKRISASLKSKQVDNKTSRGG